MTRNAPRHVFYFEMVQQRLFDDEPPIGHTDPQLPDDAVPRLGGQNGLVLERLRRGSATNVELERVSGSRRINSRVADVRRYLMKHCGETVVSTAVDTATGLYRYEIRSLST